MRYFIKLAYKGTNYHGWQVQPNAMTIQGLLTKSFSTIFRTPLEFVGAGRTDTGVHAEEFYAHVDIENEFKAEEIIYKVNALLPKDIVVYDIFKTAENAHARFDAISRSYEYRIFLGKNPFFTETAWQFISTKLAVEKMNEAANILKTHNNFKCFSRSNTDVRTYNCTIMKAEWKLTNQLLVFHITADRFLRNMVRAIVGTLIEIGKGKMTLQEFKEIIESENRSNAGPSAPAQGLFLTNVTYPKTIFIHEQ
ncbi:MAG: tRNA pseudouridine(38-40) synthase TruA [Lutibacter sp.]|nr:tRNA pseudouridine(38-40) synthase TruA [Lutibacter sp.]